VSSTSQIPEVDVTNLCLWLKNTLSHKVKTVKLSSRLTSTPAILVGQMSSSMYMMMQMMASQQGMQGQMPEMPKDLTLEINTTHPTIVNLNVLRKEQPDFAKEIALMFLDQVLVTSNIPSDFKDGHHRQ